MYPTELYLFLSFFLFIYLVYAYYCEKNRQKTLRLAIGDEDERT